MGQKCRFCKISTINHPPSSLLRRSEIVIASQNHHKIGHVNLWHGSGNPHPSYLQIYKKYCQGLLVKLNSVWGSFLHKNLFQFILKSSIFGITLLLSSKYLLSMPPFHTHLSSCLCISEAVKYFWRSLVRHSNRPLLTTALWRCLNSRQTDRYSQDVQRITLTKEWYYICDVCQPKISEQLKL